MSRSYISCAIAFFTLLALASCGSESADENSQPEQVAANAEAGIPKTFCVGVEGKTYGAGISEMKIASIAAIAADPKAYDGETVRVEGMVTDVCPKRGCWFEMAGENPGDKLRFKVNDGEMVFPMDAKGEYAVAQGVVMVDELSLEDTRAREQHFAEEAGESFDPESITEGMTVFRIQGTGAVIGKQM